MIDFKFFVQVESTTKSFTEIENKRNDNIIMSSKNVELIYNISKKFKIGVEYITVNKKYYKYNVINDLPDTTSTTVIHDYDILKYYNSRLNDVILFIHDESKLFETIFYVYERTYGNIIDLRLDKLSNYNINILEQQLELLVEFLKSERNILIPQLNSFHNKEKFRNNGLEYFISPDLKVYKHANHYYTNDESGYICNFIDFDFLNPDTHLEIQPHIICEICDTFYCDRNIYNNKIYTSEYKVPASIECEKTTLLSKYSKLLYDKLYDSKNDKDVDLDKVMDYHHDTAFITFEKNMVNTNNIKEYIPNNRIKK